MPLISNAAAEDRRIILVTPAKHESEFEVRQIRETVSQPAPQGGYFANSAILDCFAVMKYYYTGGRYDNDPILFRMRCPRKLSPGKKYPLVIWLHGVGESDDDNMRQLSHIQSMYDFLVGPKSLDFFMLATQCPSDNTSWTHSVSNKGKGDAPITIAHEIVGHLLREFPIDPDRVSVAGPSSGGSMTWRYAAMYPEMFSAILPLSSSPPAVSPTVFKNIPVWAFNNRYDGQALPDPVGDYVKKINAAGGNACLTVGDISSHDTWTGAMKQYNAVVWLTLQRRGGTLAPPPGCVYHFRSSGTNILLFGVPVVFLLSLFVMRRSFYRYDKDCVLEQNTRQENTR